MGDFGRIEKQVLKLIAQAKEQRKAKSMKEKIKRFFEAIVDFTTSRKFYVALIGAALQLIPIFIQPVPEWYGVVLAFFTAIGVYSIPNEKK